MVVLEEEDMIYKRDLKYIIHRHHWLVLSVFYMWTISYLMVLSLKELTLKDKVLVLLKLMKLPLLLLRYISIFLTPFLNSTLITIINHIWQEVAWEQLLWFTLMRLICLKSLFSPQIIHSRTVIMVLEVSYTVLTKELQLKTITQPLLISLQLLKVDY